MNQVPTDLLNLFGPQEVRRSISVYVSTQISKQVILHFSRVKRHLQ